MRYQGEIIPGVTRLVSGAEHRIGRIEGLDDNNREFEMLWEDGTRSKHKPADLQPLTIIGGLEENRPTDNRPRMRTTAPATIIDDIWGCEILHPGATEDSWQLPARWSLWEDDGGDLEEGAEIWVLVAEGCASDEDEAMEMCRAIVQVRRDGLLDEFLKDHFYGARKKK